MPGGNPFKFGSVVQGGDFIDRDKERHELKTHIRNHANIILSAPRRYGKTSLIYETLAEMEREEKNFISIVVDFYAVHSRQKFLSLLADQIFKKLGWSFERILDWFRQSIRGIQPVLTTDESGAPRLEIQFHAPQHSQSFEDILDLPNKLSQQGKLVCIVFDEFQEITRLNGKNFQKELRAQIQHHNQISYILCGSKQHLISELFNNSSAPFYNFGKFWSLGKIPESEFTPFLQNQMQRIKQDFSETDARDLFESGEGIPYYVQLIAYEYFNLVLAEPGLSHAEYLEKSNQQLLENQSAEFLLHWEKLNSSQKQALEIILKTDGESLFSKENLSNYNIAASTLKKSLTQLQEMAILVREGDRYGFQNVFFRHWLLTMV